MFCGVRSDADDFSTGFSAPSDSTSFSFSFLSLSRMEKSNPVPPLGVFGVFADPNEAKAPVPSPKADEAPTPGDLIEAGEAALNGCALDVESPNRLLENGRDESALDVSLASMSRVDRVGLSLVLELC